MNALIIFVIVVAALILLALAVKIVKQYERGVVLRFGRLVGVRNPGFNLIIPFVDRMTKISLRIVTIAKIGFVLSAVTLQRDRVLTRECLY